MADLARFAEHLERVTVEWQGTPLTIAYRPPTEAMDREVFGGDSGVWHAENVRKFLVLTIREWDLTSGGEPCPVAHETLMQLPGEVVVGLWRLIRGLDDDDPKRLKTVSPSIWLPTAS